MGTVPELRIEKCEKQGKWGYHVPEWRRAVIIDGDPSECGSCPDCPFKDVIIMQWVDDFDDADYAIGLKSWEGDEDGSTAS